MSNIEETPDMEEGRLPPSTLTSLARSTEIDLESMTVDELMGLIDDILNLLPAKELREVRDTVDDKRHAKLEDAKNEILREMKERLADIGMTIDEALPSSYSGSSRRQRSDAGQPLPIKYRGPAGETWSGRGRTPGWLIALESIGQNREEFRVPE